MNTINATSTSSLRICVLTKADTLCWTQHYVDAFRERADVITVGPGYDAKQIEDWNLGDLVDRLIPNDIETDLDSRQSLRTILPDGWNPDLIVVIANGGVTLQPDLEGIICPTAYITVDTWQSISDYVEAQLYDFVFPAQKTSVEYLRAVGAANVFWLPLGCNPKSHYPVDVPREFDVAFAGSVTLPVHQVRHDLIQHLKSAFSVHMTSQVFYDDLCRTIAAGKLVFNHSAVHEVNMRIFEVMAMGRPLITNRDADRNGLTGLVEDGKHLILYDDSNELVEKVRYYLEHEDEREAIARAGYDLATTTHRYLDRIDTLLTTIADRVPSFGKRENSATTLSPSAELVPYGSGTVIDAGLELRPHLQSLKQRGLTMVIGMIEESATHDSLEYDDLVSTNDVPIQANVLSVATSKLFGDNVLSALDKAYGMLSSGGTLILRLGAQDFSAALGITSLTELEEVFAQHGFHVTGCKMDEAESAGVIVRARKRTRALAEVVKESHTALTHMDTEGLLGWAKAFGPNY